MNKRTKKLHLVIELVVLIAVIFMALSPARDSGYRRFATDTLRYVRGTVLEVTSETLSDSTLETGQKLGVQTLRVRLSDGQELSLTNYLTETHNILLKKSDRVIICADLPENAAPYYTVYNYDRTIPLMGLAAVFVLLLVLVGRRKGADACLSILFTLAFILRVLLPALYSGASPVGMGLVTVLLSTSVTLLLIHGASVQCLLSICATMIGELIACGLFAVFSQMLHLTGFQTDSAEGLLLIAQNYRAEYSDAFVRRNDDRIAGSGHGRGGVGSVRCARNSACRRTGQAENAVCQCNALGTGYDRNHEQHTDLCFCRQCADHHAGVLLLWRSVSSDPEF